MEGSQREPGEGEGRQPDDERADVTVVSHPPKRDPEDRHRDGRLDEGACVSSGERKLDEDVAHSALRPSLVAAATISAIGG